jgi:hypothetical protein
MDHPPSNLNANVGLSLYVGLFSVVVSIPLFSFVVFLATSDSCFWGFEATDGLPEGWPLRLAIALAVAAVLTVLDCIAFLLHWISPNVFALLEALYDNITTRIFGSSFRPLLPVFISTSGTTAPQSGFDFSMFPALFTSSSS